jgi:hypothetical protein
MVTPLPKQNTFEEMMHVLTFTPSDPVHPELVEFSTSQEYNLEDPLHLCGDERSSTPLIEFEPLPTGSYHVVSDRGRESTLFIHDTSLEMKNSWAMEIYKELTLGSKGKNLIDKHGSFILDSPLEPCLHHILQSQPRLVHRAHCHTRPNLDGPLLAHERRCTCLVPHC